MPPRPRALLTARLLLITCLAAAGERDEAERLLLPVVRRCAEQGLAGLLRYADPRVPALLRDMVDAGTHPLPSAFVSEVLTPR